MTSSDSDTDSSAPNGSDITGEASKGANTYSSPIDRGIWRLWKPLAIGLPILLLFVAAAGGGWETLILLLTAPVWLPALILLDLLPRFLLRKQGLTAAPTIVTTFMILHWWGLALAALTLEGVGDTGSLPSTLGRIVRWLPTWLEQGLFTTGLLLALGGWVGAIVSAVVVRHGLQSPHPGQAPSTLQTPPAQPPSSLRPASSHMPWIAIAVVPLAVGIALSSGYVWVTHGQTDAAGFTESDVIGIDIDDALRMKDENWDALQQRVVPLREAISPDGWALHTEPNIPVNGVSWDVELEGVRYPLGSYTLETSWKLSPQPATLPTEHMIEAAEQAGWRLVGPPDPARWESDGFRFETGDGFVAEVYTTPDGDFSRAGVVVEVRTPGYWDEGRAQIPWDELTTPSEFAGLDGQDPQTFAADAWPELRVVEAWRQTQ